MTFGKDTAEKYVDFNTLYQGYDIDVVTAARLSATFPYVSPICRANIDIPENKYHFADGGYFDNSGFVTAAQWLDERLDEWRKPESLNIKRVLILQINPFPESPTNEEEQSNEKAQGNGGWFMTTLGPLLAMFKVRDPVLASRNAMEAKLLIKRWKEQVEREKMEAELLKEQRGEQVKAEKYVDIQYFPIFFPSKKQAPKFYDKRGRYQPPLSWRLTDDEKDAIRDGWNEIKQGQDILKIKTLWHDIWNMPKD